MALTMPFPDPTDVTTVQDAYILCSALHMDFTAQRGKIAYTIHRSHAAAHAGASPLGTITYELTPTGAPARYGAPLVLTPEVPARLPVYGLDGTVLDPGTPGSPAVYGDALLLVPAFPSFSELMGENGPAYAAVAQAVYALALSRPEFQGATVYSE